MITSPMHNAKWRATPHPTLDAAIITARWEVGGMLYDYNFIVRPTEHEMFWSALAMMARRLGEQVGYYQDAEAKRMHDYQWWRRNSSMFA